MRLAASLLLASVALSFSAAAENSRLAAAVRLYQRAELDAAVAELKAAEDQSKDENDLVQILIYRGLISAEMGQAPQMQESFKRALAMRPWADVPQDTSPRLAKLFNDARREVWGSPGIKPWPKRKEGAPSDKPATDKPAEEKPGAAAPSAPPGMKSPSSAPAHPASESPSTPPAADPAPEKPAEAASPPAEAPTTPPAPADDAPPDVAPTTP
jgi:tetratricopeptide (TPR) repeat protein